MKALSLVFVFLSGTFGIAIHLALDAHESDFHQDHHNSDSHPAIDHEQPDVMPHNPTANFSDLNIVRTGFAARHPVFRILTPEPELRPPRGSPLSDSCTPRAPPSL